MSKLCMLRREAKRKLLCDKYYKRRVSLKKQIKSPVLSLEEKEKYQNELNSLPRDSCKIRRRRRCAETGRSRGVYRKFGLCRQMLRKHAAFGDIPGLHKASW